MQSDDLPDVVGADDKADDLRLELNKRLAQDADDVKLPHVDIDLAGKADLDRFKLDDAGFAFFLFQRGKVTASRVLRQGEQADRRRRQGDRGPERRAVRPAEHGDLRDARRRVERPA